MSGRQGEPVKMMPPPGFKYSDADEYVAGRWYQGTLVRWHGEVPKAIGGWTPLLLSDDSTEVRASGEPIRGMHQWYTSAEFSKLAYGSKTYLLLLAAGVITDITPSDLTVGEADETETSGLYGDGAYGSGLYGTGAGVARRVEATTWSLDNFGEDLVAVSTADQRLLRWSPGDSDASVVSDAPEGVGFVFVTPERFVVTLGATVDTRDPRLVSWSDQEDATTWTPTAGNQAGDLPLRDSPGALLAGRAMRSESLLWSTSALYAMRYIGGTLVYKIRKIADAVGALSRQSMAVLGNRAYWMGEDGFFIYSGGGVQAIPHADIHSYVFHDLNEDQKSKIVARTQQRDDEVWWHYPSSGSTENDRYVKLNVETGAWDFGELARTAGVDVGVRTQQGSSDRYDLPLAADPEGDASIYLHEIGTSMKDGAGADLTPYLETGPLDLLDSDVRMELVGMIPADGGSGEVQYYFITADYPEASESTSSAYAAASKIDVRINTRRVRIKVEQVTHGWQLGPMRLFVQPGGTR